MKKTDLLIAGNTTIALSYYVKRNFMPFTF